MTFTDMTKLSETQLKEAAIILNESLNIGWPTFLEAMNSIREWLKPKNNLLAAIEDEKVIGFGGITPKYDGNVFELEVLAVKNERHRNHIGSSILQVLEQTARERGGRTMYIGSDDETGETSLSDVDLYVDLPKKIADFIPGAHPTGFYIKQGYKIVGVLPDANGDGKPDIFLVKRLLTDV